MQYLHMFLILEGKPNYYSPSYILVRTRDNEPEADNQ